MGKCMLRFLPCSGRNLVSLLLQDGGHPSGSYLNSSWSKVALGPKQYAMQEISDEWRR
jgi:hypothetical protein